MYYSDKDKVSKYSVDQNEHKKVSSGEFYKPDGTHFVYEYENVKEPWKESTNIGTTEQKWSEGKYVGEWKNGKKHGWGLYFWPDGSHFVGEYANG